MNTDKPRLYLFFQLRKYGVEVLEFPWAEEEFWVKDKVSQRGFLLAQTVQLKVWHHLHVLVHIVRVRIWVGRVLDREKEWLCSLFYIRPQFTMVHNVYVEIYIWTQWTVKDNTMKNVEIKEIDRKIHITKLYKLKNGITIDYETNKIYFI